jgi:hypothetical protein
MKVQVWPGIDQGKVRQERNVENLLILVAVVLLAIAMLGFVAPSLQNG